MFQWVMTKGNGPLSRLKTESIGNCMVVFRQEQWTYMTWLVWLVCHLVLHKEIAKSMWCHPMAIPGRCWWSPCALCGRGAPRNRCWEADPGVGSSSHWSACRPATCQLCTLLAALWPGALEVGRNGTESSCSRQDVTNRNSVCRVVLHQYFTLYILAFVLNMQNNRFPVVLPIYK